MQKQLFIILTLVNISILANSWKDWLKQRNPFTTQNPKAIDNSQDSKTQQEFKIMMKDLEKNTPEYIERNYTFQDILNKHNFHDIKIRTYTPNKGVNILNDQDKFKLDYHRTMAKNYWTAYQNKKANITKAPLSKEEEEKAAKERDKIEWDEISDDETYDFAK